MSCKVLFGAIIIVLIQALCLIDCEIDFKADELSPVNSVKNQGVQSNSDDVTIINDNTPSASNNNDNNNQATGGIEDVILTETIVRQQQQEENIKKCVPMLNFGFGINSTTSSSSNAASSNIVGPNASYSFNINDIDLPIAQADSSVNSAMKLLSTFTSQFDPFQLSDSLSNSGSEQIPDNVVRFKENNLFINGLNLSMLNIHLFTDNDSKFGLGITIKNTTMTGKFSYNGPLAITETKLAAYYRMSIDNIYIVASSNLTKQQNSLNNNQDELGDSDDDNDDAMNQYNLVTNDFKLNITNLGYISIDIFDRKDSTKPTSNYLLRMLQRFLQKTIKRTYFTFENYIKKTLEKESKRLLDCELTRFTPLLDKSAKNNKNDFTQIISGEINRLQLSTVTLPDFDHNQNVLGSSALVLFYNGSLSGLHNIQLNGETRIKLQNEQHLFVNTSIGWKDIKPYYNWELYLGSTAINNSRSSTSAHLNPTAKGHVSFTIKAIDFDAVITKGLKPHTKIIVDQLVIKRLDSPKMDISGLPGMNRVTRGMVNFFMGRLKQRLAASIQPTLKQQLERSLNKMSLFN